MHATRVIFERLYLDEARCLETMRSRLAGVAEHRIDVLAQLDPLA